MTIEKIKKRDGREVEFNEQKIKQAITKAAVATNKDNPNNIGKAITDLVISDLEDYYDKKEIISVEQVQDIVEFYLMKNYQQVAKSYILYREQHKNMRNTKKIFEDSINTIDKYVNNLDWKIKENSNMGYSLQGLNNHIASEVTSQYWLQKVYPQNIREKHVSGDLHIHDLGNLSVYCCGWDLKDILLNGFSGVERKVESGAPKHFGTALLQLVNFFYTLQGEAAGAQAVSNFDTLLAPFIAYDNLEYEEVKQAMQEFIFNLNVPTRVGFQTPFTNITMDLKVPDILADEPVIIGGEPKERTYKEFQDEVDMVNKAFAEVMLEGDKKGRIFSFPIPTYNITPDFDWENELLDPIWKMTAKYGTPYFSNFVNSDMDPSDVRSMCCRLRLDNRELRKKGGGLFGSNPMTGSIGVVTVNMPRIGYQAETKEEFIDKVLELMDLAKESLEIKRELLEKLTEGGLYPYSKFYLRSVKQRFDQYWKNHFNTIGLLGVNEALLNFMGKDIATSKGKEFAIKLMDVMRDRLQEYQEETGNIYNLEATPGEGTTYRFAKLDKEEFGTDIIFANQDRVISDDVEPYYTNSTQLPVGCTNDIFEALDLQDDLQKRYTGGTVLHGFLGEKMPSIESTKKLVKRIADNYELPYYSITPTFSVCPTHGYLPGAHEYCPKCDAESNYSEE
jgi:ribonucleoside-triphosphate reductase